MQTNPQIVPAILATTEEEYQEKITKVSAALKSPDQWVQIDIMDGKFVPNKSVGLNVIRKYPTMLIKEAHLMVQHPTQDIFELIDLGFERIVIHIESDDVQDNLAYIEDQGRENGLAINPDTPLEQLEPYLKDIDVVLIMSVHPGVQGSGFITGSLEKIKECSCMRADNNLNFKIEVDGGISAENAKLVVETGADYLVVGSHSINGNIAENLEKIRESIRA